MLKNWTKIFLYNIRNNKLFTFLNILGLSIGISGLIFAILYWNDEHAYNEWNPEKEHIYQVLNDLGNGMDVWATNVAPLGAALKEVAPEVESYCYVETIYGSENIRYKGKKVLLTKIMDAQQNFFTFFPFDFVQGNGAEALPDGNSIALSEDAAKQLFGDENPIGKQILYGTKNLVVRGVYRIPGKSSIAPTAVTGFMEGKLKGSKDHWGNYYFGLLLKLKSPNAVAAIEQKIKTVFFEHKVKPQAKEEGISPEEYMNKYGVGVVILEPLESARLHSVTQGYPEGRGNYQFLLIMLGLSILILVLSIVNYINLATANAIKRAKEVGVRKILGANKGNIIRQFVYETVLMAVVAILLSLVIVELSLPYYNNFLGKELVIHSGQFYAQLVLIFGIVVVFAGIFPATYVANFETLNVLKGNFGRSKTGTWLRNGMLILQFAIASFFIIGSYIVYQQVAFMSQKELGFKGAQIIEVNYRVEGKKQPYEHYRTIRQELLRMKGVEEVSTGTFSFGNGVPSSSGFEYKGVNIQGKNMSFDFGMLEMMHIRIAEGRTLSESLSSDTINAVLVNQTTVKLMGEKNAIGKQLLWNGEKFNVVGVVADFHIEGPQNKIPPMIFFHFKTVRWMEGNMNQIYVKVAPENMGETIGALEQFWNKNVDADYPFHYEFVDKNFARTYESFVKQRNLFSLLNIVVITISLFGLFALATFSIERRMKEIAIRKTLGAETKVLLRELSKQYLIFCIIGFLIALFPVYFLLSMWLDNFAFRISISILPFIIGFVILVVLTLSVVLSKAYQATRVNVLKYLKYE
ncbi:ABC transporter permease [Flavobacterium kingsejongi]|uniref:Multidrug ABC transporter substrate-binding protein n=1 Tax=Flavobacterium kingsejongi TaxID=1678728 RepID=A0A2S1LMK2_9FLAO|nr:ABC transporter permease [Flavobacterium kingsejongi]AWG24983.1 multidrug ABC transporter substrate-binding protein [Flavobacterium kingsejongi]